MNGGFSVVCPKGMIMTELAESTDVAEMIESMTVESFDLPEAITTTWELATVQACVIHLIRNTFRPKKGYSHLLTMMSTSPTG
jgi:mutator family transposase